MIALVDKSRKGYVTLAEFVPYFTDRNYVDEEKLPKLPPHMENRRKWVQAIEENLEVMQHYQDREYC